MVVGVEDYYSSVTLASEKLANAKTRNVGVVGVVVL